MTKYLLDTNIYIHIIKKKPIEVLEKFKEYTVGDIAISSITVAELKYGVQKSQLRERNDEALQKFLIPIVIEDFDYKAAAVYGRIRSHLESKGTPIGPLDNLIAAHALSLNVTLVTNNTKEFKRVPGLTLANWATN